MKHSLESEKDFVLIGKCDFGVCSKRNLIPRPFPLLVCSWKEQQCLSEHLLLKTLQKKSSSISNSFCQQKQSEKQWQDKLQFIWKHANPFIK